MAKILVNGVWKDVSQAHIVDGGVWKEISTAHLHKDGAWQETDLNSFALRSVTTEASATPSTTHITLVGAQNAVRIYTGEQSVTEAYFYLYVSRSGGAVKKIKMYRWQGRILTGISGETLSFGTSDGRALSVAPMIVPVALESVS